jgi:peptidyl-prolyl cis-trans isomerase SurA
MKHILAVIGTFLSLITWAQPQGEVIERIIGVVGGEIMLQSELEGDVLQMKMQGTDPSSDDVCSAVEQLLFQKLLLNQAKVDSLEVSEAEIQAQIENRLSYFLQMFGTVEAFEKEYGKSIAQWKAEFHDPIKEQLLVERMRYSLDNKVTATPKEVRNFYESIPKDSIPLISEEIQYSQLVIEPKPTEIEKARIRAIADSVRTLVTTGKMTMTIAALRFSDDPGSKYKGGCYENVRKGAFVPEYEAAVQSTKEGEYSPVFESDFGYHFVKVTEKRGEVFSSCHVLFSPKVNEYDLVAASAKLDSITLAIKNDSISFYKAALRYSTDDDTRNQGGKVTNYQEGGLRHNVDNLDRNVFFVLDKLKVGEISQPISLETPSGTPYYVILRLDARTAAHKANMTDDYLLFKQQAEAKMRAESFNKWVQKRITLTYVKVNDEYKDCEFQFPWVKSNL